jgi:hypothetical protein
LDKLDRDEEATELLSYAAAATHAILGSGNQINETEKN